jgi:hypothetical protein
VVILVVEALLRDGAEHVRRECRFGDWSDLHVVIVRWPMTAGGPSTRPEMRKWFCRLRTRRQTPPSLHWNWSDQYRFEVICIIELSVAANRQEGHRYVMTAHLQSLVDARAMFICTPAS